MLYERWRHIAAARAGEPALRDGASGRRWTFRQLADEAERRPSAGGIAHPQGQGTEFVFDLLAAWRDRRIVWPLETGETPLHIPTPPGHCRHIKSTSGTTGKPRVVAFTEEQLAADADNIVLTMGLSAGRPNLGVISLAHSYGFSNLVLPLLLHGVPLILGASVLPEVIRNAAPEEKELALAAVPALWRAWHDAAAIPLNVTLAISAGAPLPIALERDMFDSRGLKIHNFYGASECGGIAYDQTKTPRVDASLAGTSMDNVTISLNEHHCARVVGRAVGETYWPEPDDSLGCGAFQTSDLARVDGGAIYLDGRLTDQINVAGRKIWPETVERALMAHPGVRECVVFGAPSDHAERTETIVAIIAGGATEAELKDFLLQTLPAWQVPREWHFVDSFDRGPRGKISRAEWRRRLKGERSQQESTPPSKPEFR